MIKFNEFIIIINSNEFIIYQILKIKIEGNFLKFVDYLQKMKTTKAKIILVVQ